MEKSKFVYLGSLVILVVLIALAFCNPITTELEYSSVQRTQLLERGTERIIQFDIINHEQKYLPCRSGKDY